MMTEPELVSIGDEACIDSASLVAHLNSRGNFELRSVAIGPQATLLRSSRVLAGAAVQAGGVLLEHTLVMSGDAVDVGATWQGWPAEVVPATDSRLLSQRGRKGEPGLLGGAVGKSCTLCYNVRKESLSEGDANKV